MRTTVVGLIHALRFCLLGHWKHVSKMSVCSSRQLGLGELLIVQLSTFSNTLILANHTKRSFRSEEASWNLAASPTVKLNFDDTPLNRALKHIQINHHYSKNCTKIITQTTRLTKSSHSQ